MGKKKRGNSCEHFKVEFWRSSIFDNKCNYRTLRYIAGWRLSIPVFYDNLRHNHDQKNNIALPIKNINKKNEKKNYEIFSRII